MIALQWLFNGSSYRVLFSNSELVGAASWSVEQAGRWSKMGGGASWSVEQAGRWLKICGGASWSEERAGRALFKLNFIKLVNVHLCIHFQIIIQIKIINNK